MAFKISGFGGGEVDKVDLATAGEAEKTVTPRKSLVQIRFPGKGVALTYFNDLFDLKLGDRVYVDGKMEGQLGRVTEITYNFKIKLSDYRKVIAVVDTDVHGQFHMVGSHFVTFDSVVLPVNQIALWFKPPQKEEEEIIVSTDDTSFHLDDLKGMNISPVIAERGHDYYLENRVRYICLDHSKGIAIVEGTENYLVEFDYHEGEISHLICECPCGYTCKHAFAAMLQLKETLDLIEKRYAHMYEESGYFAAINKATLFSFAVDGKETGSFSL